MSNALCTKRRARIIDGYRNACLFPLVRNK